jgi:D-alanine-D-alanine ligase
MLPSKKKARPTPQDLRPFVWALIPYSIEDSLLMEESEETAITKAELAGVFDELGLSWIWQPVAPGSIKEIAARVSEAMRGRATLAFNFCDGLDRDGYPGVSVVRELEKAGIPFTGSDSRFYEISTYKLRMKRLFLEHGIETAPWEVLPRTGPVEGVCERLGAPLMVKPDVSCASYGITLKSKVVSDAEIQACRNELQQGENGSLFSGEDIFAERYLAGEEYTLFVGGFWDDPEQIWTLSPARRCFADSIPPEERFLSYDRYWGYYKEESMPPNGEPFYRYELVHNALGKELVSLATRAYRTVKGHGYARVDIRRDTVNGKLSVLEVNANCGLSGDDETSTGSILQLMGMRYSGLVQRILNQTLKRYKIAGAKADLC